MKRKFTKNLFRFFCVVLFCAFFRNQTVFAQTPWWVGGNTTLGGSQPYIGTNINSWIELITNGATRMHINENTGTTSGFVGINNTSPFFQLDVNGFIDITDATKGYCIGGTSLTNNEVLQYHGNTAFPSSTTNIFVGVGAGSINAVNIMLDQGLRNTYLGNDAGHLNDVESDETFLGYQAGYNTHSGPGNTFAGSSTGYNNTYGHGNVFMGYWAGYYNTGVYNTDSATYNTFVGNLCGENNILGRANCFYGKHAGANNQNGDFNVEVGNHSGEESISHNLNTFVGYRSGMYNGINTNGNGYNNTMIGDYVGVHNGGNYNCFFGENTGYQNKGNRNTFIGYRASIDSAYYSNSTALGAYAMVKTSNNMILGNDTVWVGIGLSGVTPAPQNSLDINARNNTTGAVIPYWSGLRFRQLPGIAASLTTVNPGPGILALDPTGNVIYVPETPGPGNVCGSASPLTNDYEIRLGTTNGQNGFNYVFTQQADGSSAGYFSQYRVGIGLIGSTLCSPKAKLDILERAQNSGVYSGLLSDASITYSTGLKVHNMDNFSWVDKPLKRYIEGINDTVDGQEFSNSRVAHFAGRFFATNADTNYGGYFNAFTTNLIRPKVNYGINSNASYGITNYAGYFKAIGINGTYISPSNTYGGYFIAQGGNCNAYSYGIKTIANYSGGSPYCAHTCNYGIWAQGNSPGWAGYFVGNVAATGYSIIPSDSVLKQNKGNITNALGLISKLQPHTFNFDTVNYSFMNLPSGRQFGLYAEQADTIVPELVKDVTFPAQLDTAGNIITPEVNYQGLNYVGLIPITIQAVKDLDSVVTQIQNTTPPNKPILSYPANGADSIPLQVVLTWQRAARAFNYTVYISQPLQNSATANAVNANGTAVGNGTAVNGGRGRGLSRASLEIINAQDTFAMVGLPNYYTSYTWYVVANNQAGSSSISDQWSFTTLMPPLPSAPVLLLPSDSSGNLPLANTFTWNTSASANYYTLYISTDSTYNNIVSKVSVSDTFGTASVPNYSTTYYWWVVAGNVSGQSPVSAIWNFVTTGQPPKPPAAPQLATPINGDTVVKTPTGSVPSLNWYSSIGADFYTLYISTTPDSTGIIFNNMVVDTFSFAQLPYDTTYYWWVVAYNKNSGEDAKSNVWNFVVKKQYTSSPAAPQLSSPEKGDTVMIYPKKPLALNWYSSPGATSYTLYLSTTPDSSGLFYNKMNVDTFSYVQLPYDDTTYYWAVVACNQYSCSKLSEIWHFFAKSVVSPIPKQITEPTLSDKTLMQTNAAGTFDTLKNAMKLIMQMNPLKFYWDTIHHSWLPSIQQIGLIGQEINNIVPQVVFKDAKGYSNIQYGRLSALLVEGMKEMVFGIYSIDTTLQGNIDSLNKEVKVQNAIIDSLKNVDALESMRFDSLINVDAGYNTMFDSLQAQIYRCCSNKNDKTINQNNNDNNDPNQTPSIHNIELANNAILYQNAPNPFGNGTIIKYFVPDYTDAQIVFYDEFGNQLKKYNIEEKGMGQLNVDASNLSAGIYSYSLIVNSKVIDSKKMICSK